MAHAAWARSVRRAACSASARQVGWAWLDRGLGICGRDAPHREDPQNLLWSNPWGQVLSPPPNSGDGFCQELNLHPILEMGPAKCSMLFPIVMMGLYLESYVPLRSFLAEGGTREGCNRVQWPVPSLNAVAPI